VGGPEGSPAVLAGNALSGEVDDNVGENNVYRGQEMPSFQDFKRYCEQTGMKKIPPQLQLRGGKLKISG
jgi:hypothetical protein